MPTKKQVDPPCVSTARRLIDGLYDEIRDLRIQFVMLWIVVNEVANYLPEGTHRSMLEGVLNETKLLYLEITGKTEDNNAIGAPKV